MSCPPLFRMCWLALATLCLCACSSSSQLQKRRAMYSIESHETAPQHVFVYKDDVYINYVYEQTPFYFIASTVPDEKNAAGYSLLKPHRASDTDKYADASPVAVVGKEWGELVKDVIISFLPANPGEGRILFVHTYEALLYRRADGSADLTDLASAPPDVRIIGTVEGAEFNKLLFEELKHQIESSGTHYTRFLLRLDRIPLTPFMYVDIEKGLMTPLQLPPYYELEKEMGQLGFSATFLWSFVVKSHLVGIVKAPFTSSFRLLSLAASSVYTALPPPTKALDGVPPLNMSGEEMNLADFNAWLDKNITRQNYKGSVELLIDGEEFFPHFMLAAQRAQHSIFTRVYIFSTDPYGLKIADLLKERASDGIDVRVLTDELNTVLNSAKEPALNYPADFVMPKSIKSYLRKDSSAKARTHYNTWATFDHTKVYLIDRELAYTGGMNIGQEYRYTWHDMMVALRGPVVGQLVKKFYEAWSFNGWGGDFAAAYRKVFSKKQRRGNREEPGMIDVRLLYTKPSQPEIFHAQLEAIKRAKRRIYIQNAYFSDDRIVGELIKARGRGVDVRVMWELWTAIIKSWPINCGTMACGFIFIKE